MNILFHTYDTGSMAGLLCSASPRQQAKDSPPSLAENEHNHDDPLHLTFAHSPCLYQRFLLSVEGIRRHITVQRCAGPPKKQKLLSISPLL
jgi:hypothetical protein